MYLNEHSRRKQVDESRNSLVASISDKDLSTVASREPIRAPPFLPPIYNDPNIVIDEIPIDPALLGLGPSTLPYPLDPNPPLTTNHFFDSTLQVCSCPSFLRSQFLRCKHITLSTKQEVLGDGTPGDEDLWFEVVERYREPPFWRVPETAREIARRRKLGLNPTKEALEAARQREEDMRDMLEQEADESEDDDEVVWRVGEHSDEEEEAEEDREEPVTDGRVESERSSGFAKRGTFLTCFTSLLDR